MYQFAAFLLAKIPLLFLSCTARVTDGCHDGAAASGVSNEDRRNRLRQPAHWLQSLPAALSVADWMGSFPG